MNLHETLQYLTGLQGGSGFEDQVIAVMSERMQSLGAQVHVDAMGNVIVRVGAQQGERRVMVCAHTDEISLIVKYVDEHGFVYFDANGTISAAALPATQVDVLTATGSIPGVIVARSSHLLNMGATGVETRLEDLWIEVGARSAAEVRELGVQVGDCIVFRPNFRELGNGYIASKSIDDRAGCAILLQLAEALRDRRLDYELYLVACVQEEVGSRGAGVAARTLQPHLALVVDGVSAREPGMPANRAPVVLGGGPVLRSADLLHGFLGTLYSPRLRRRLAATAERLGMPYQFDVARTWTDASTIHTIAEGVPTAGLFIPRRGSHSPVEVACVADIENAFRLVQAFLINLTCDSIDELRAQPTVRRE